MQVRLDIRDVLGIMAEVADVRPDLRAGIDAASKWISVGDSITLTTVAGPIHFAISIAISAPGDGSIELNIIHISANLFGEARKLAGDMIISHLGALPGLRAWRNQRGNISLAIDGLRCTAASVRAGVITLELVAS